jgi:hypothetical protein
MYANKPCATPFFYTPAPGLSFDNKGYLSAVNDWRTATPPPCSGRLPRWPVCNAKIYPIVDQTVNYFMAYPSNPPDINQMTDTTQDWPYRACRLS